MRIKPRERGLRAALISVALGLIAVVGTLYLDLKVFEVAIGCSPWIQQFIVSPNGRYNAVIYQMECGATVGLNTQVSVVPQGEKLSSDHHPAFFVLDGRHALSLEWRDGEALYVTLPASAHAAKVFRQDQSSRGVQIAYHP